MTAGMLEVEVARFSLECFVVAWYLYKMEAVEGIYRKTFWALFLIP